MSGSYSVTVRDRVMIAHSFQGKVFGPAQGLHGATYVVEATFSRAQLDPDGIVVDIGLAHRALALALRPLAFKNLDTLEDFEGINTTTEYLAGWLWGKLRDMASGGELGRHAWGLSDLAITLHESDVAWARYSAPLRP